MDAITVLRDDHDRVRKLFREFEGLGDDATTSKRELADKIIEELTIHAFVEEQVFYPAIRDLEVDAKEQPEDLVKEAEEEHKQVETLLMELEGLAPGDEYFDAKMTVVIDNVTHHAEEEEQEMFPKVREALGRGDLQDLLERMEEAKARAPKRPSEKAERETGAA